MPRVGWAGRGFGAVEKAERCTACAWSRRHAACLGRAYAQQAGSPGVDREEGRRRHASPLSPRHTAPAHLPAISMGRLLSHGGDLVALSLGSRKCVCFS